MRRKRTIAPFTLLIACISTLAAGQVSWLADILRTFNKISSCGVEYKPFHNQLAKPRFPEFMRLVLERLMRQSTSRVLQSLPAGLLSEFNDILLHDGSSLAIKDSLKKEWPGRFTKVSPAAVEIHVTMSAFEDNPISVELAPDKESERAYGPLADDVRGCLLLEDRGYQSREFFRHVQAAEGFYIVRGTKNIRPTIVEARGTNARRVRHIEGKKLTWKMLPRQNLDLEIEWGTGSRTYRGRLIVIYRKGKRNKKTFVYLHTNLSRAEFSWHQVGLLYRLRWQIELLFKDWKSYANLHRFDTGKSPIAEGLIWASLVTATLRRSITHAAEHVLQVAMSTQRAASASRHFLDDILRALLDGGSLTRVLDSVVSYLGDNARRAHPDRDRKSGRLAVGLEHACTR